MKSDVRPCYGEPMNKTLFVTLVSVVLFAIGCTDEDGTRHALEQQGFYDIRTEGYAWFGCSDSDNFATRFTAKNPNGQPVSGVVCCGMLKSCTVRW